MSNKIKAGLQNSYYDVPLFLALAAWIIIAACLVYIFVNLGDLQAIILEQYLNHSLGFSACLVGGSFVIFGFCWGLATVVFESGYKQFSKKGF